MGPGNPLAPVAPAPEANAPDAAAAGAGAAVVAAVSPQVGSGPVVGAATRFGRYILLDRLGAGGMAEVFRALVIGPEQFQRMVVVKRILPHLSANQNFVRMFIDEATLCGRLSHPNIIQVHEFGKVDGSYFIAIEYVQGRTISAILGRLAAEGAHMPFTVAAEIARQAAMGLGHAHALTALDGAPLKIIHRDVTPGNVMVAYNGGVKVLDFGIARVAGEAQAITTDAGQVKGKSAYFAPEQLKPGPIDGRVDIWSLGIVLHEALSGRRLFKAANPLATMQLITEMEIPLPSACNRAVPPELDEIVMRALERDPQWRYRTAEEMAEALETFLIEHRYTSTELPKFVRNLFHEEVTQEVTLPRDELDALVSSVGAEAMVRRQTAEVDVSKEADADVSKGEGESLTPAVPAPFPLAISAPHASPGPKASLGAHASADNTVLASPAAATARSGAGGRRWLYAVAAIALGAAVLMGKFFLAPMTKDPAKVSPGQETQPRVAAQAVVPTVALPTSITITFSSEPAGAEVGRIGAEGSLGITPLSLVLPRGTLALDFRVAKEGYVTGIVTLIPDRDQPATIILAKVTTGSSAARTRSERGKVKNAIPIDPFAP